MFLYPDLVKFLFCFVPFFVKMWDLKACFLLIFPEPVSLKRFLALDFVFIFGMFCFLFSYSLLFYFLIGAINIIIRLPSNFGICSTFPRASKSCAKRNNKICPCSLKIIERLNQEGVRWLFSVFHASTKEIDVHKDLTMCFWIKNSCSYFTYAATFIKSKMYKWLTDLPDDLSLFVN